jgi:hypothetical protein
MPSVERTAYPRFSRSPTAQELSRFFTPTEEEITLPGPLLNFSIRPAFTQTIQAVPASKHCAYSWHKR